MKKLAFSLAEVLITLTIIGVIAAITMPALSSNFEKKQLETATLDAYNMVQNAINRYKTDNEVYDGFWHTEMLPDDNFVENHFNVKQICPEGGDCFAPSYKILNKSEEYGVYSGKGYILNNGMSIICKGSTGFTIDVNGPKRPNVLNKDLWVWQIRDDGTIADGSLSTVRPPTKSNIEDDFKKCKTGESVYGCFANFLVNGYKFDY